MRKARGWLVAFAAVWCVAAVPAAQAVSSPLVGGGHVAIVRDGDVWRVTVTGPRSGLASLCLADDSTVRILHASAAVGEAVYQKAGETWVQKSGFEFKLRNTRQGPAPDVDRRVFFTTMGWVANADDRGEQPREFAIRATSRVHYLGVTFLATGEPPALSYWPPQMDDGCRELKVAQGYLPKQAAFRPADWHQLK